MSSLDTNGVSPYYQHSASVPLASKISYHARRKMFKLFASHFPPHPDTKVLDVGVTCDSTFRESNYFEQMYPYKDRITCVGTEDGSHLMGCYPGLTYRRVSPGAPLPFATGEFDVVFSNAVLEHVGSRMAQAEFLREIRRVGKSFFVTTPDRWFPVEHHTGLPFVHYLPARLFRRILRKTRYEYWADESKLNLLTANEFRALFPSTAATHVEVVRLFGIGSNLVAYGRPAAG